MSEWIKCSDRLPKESGFYLACIEGNSIPSIEHFQNGEWVNKTSTIYTVSTHEAFPNEEFPYSYELVVNITHWQHVPSKPI